LVEATVHPNKIWRL